MISPIKDLFNQSGIFAGWPANNSKWQWDNEILVGFVSGEYKVGEKFHDVKKQFTFQQLRSIDYGKTWTIENSGIPERFSDKDLKRYNGDIAKDIFRIRGNYDHGGDYLEKRGGFFASSDRGKTWSGPYDFEGIDFLNDYENSSRTCVVDGIFYLTQKKTNSFGTDNLIPAKYNVGKFELIADMKLAKEYRVAMPSVINHSSGIIMATRAKFKEENWIEIHRYTQNKWNLLGKIGTGTNNGNPPSLFLKNNKILLCYANREMQKLLLLFIDDLDNQNSWHDITLYHSKTSDFGYPVIFDLKDGVGVIFYENNKFDRSRLLQKEVILGW